MDAAQTAGLAAWLRRQFGEVEIIALSLMSGGAIQQNFRLDAHVNGVACEWVLRTDAPATLAASRSRAEEFHLLRAGVHGRGDGAGTAGAVHGQHGDRAAVLHHAPRRRRHRRAPRGEKRKARRRPRKPGGGVGPRAWPDPCDPAAAGGSPFSPPPNPRRREQFLAEMRAALDRGPTARPMLEWGLRHLECRCPPDGETVLCHNDFRTGNFMISEIGDHRHSRLGIRRLGRSA